MSLMSSLISAVTLTHNKRAVTEKCLTSLLGTVDARWELIVVDNGSEDDTCEWLAGFQTTAAAAGVTVTVIRNDGNIGCSTARNQGAAAAAGDTLVFLDNDVALRSPRWLADLSRALDELPGAEVVGPKLVYPFAPYDIQCAGVDISPAGRVRFRGRGEARTHPEFDAPREVQCLISACWMMTRKAFETAGGFDEAFNPVQFEDFDLIYKIREAGGRAYYTPDVEMYHFESVTTAGTETLPNTYVIVKNGLLFKQRWRHMFASENGPDDSLCAWRRVETRPFASIGELPLL
ncbi:MAG: glycosyltransferase family 2 protein [Lentisphaeria bacterium]|nr:glycosyltransferase family 2 protein [Lentisphaeria bacterium]